MAGKKVAVSGEAGLEAVMGDLNARYGAGTILLLGDEGALAPVNVIPSGSIVLDEALGVGGFPRGRIIEIYGPESSGKTSLALTAAGNAQRLGLNAAVIDAEHALDPSWAELLGVDTEHLVLSQPGSGEQALQITEALTRSRKVGLIIIDSVSALVPRAELEGEIGDSHVGLQARMMSQALRKLATLASETDTAIIFINQLREKVGVLFGSPETTSGGRALKFYASVRIDVRRIETLKDRDRAYGIRVRAKVVKNKCAPPFRTAEFDFLFEEGVSRESELLDLGVERGVVKKSGAWYVYGGENLGQGKVASREFLVTHPDVRGEIEEKIRAAAPAPVKRERSRDGLAMDGPGPFDGETVLES